MVEIARVNCTRNSTLFFFFFFFFCFVLFFSNYSNGNKYYCTKKQKQSFCKYLSYRSHNLFRMEGQQFKKNKT